MKNDRVMPINVLGDMNFKFVLPFIYINFDIQTKFEINQT